MKQKENPLKKIFFKFSTWVTKATGKPTAFLLALLSVIIWAATGRLFNYSENWQLVINTGTTIVTFLMIFVIQQSQNRDTAAIHLKLNELIATNKDTSNRLVASEDLSEEELEIIKKYYKRISQQKNSESIYTSHSVDEAKKDSVDKLQSQKDNKNSKLKN
ncbi:MAG: low affinity iron permease family protein [Ferruginibacter sp.]